MSTEIIQTSPSEFNKLAADFFVKTAKQAISSDGFFAVALAGGKTPLPVYKLLSSRSGPYSQSIEWHKVHFFWTDERNVPRTDPENNFFAAKRSFLDCLKIPEENVHPIKMGNANLNEVVQSYEIEIRNFFAKRTNPTPRFHLIILGVGLDGHIASIFSKDLSKSNSKHLVHTTEHPTDKKIRVTLSMSAINQAHAVLFLVSGKEKSNIMQRAFNNKDKSSPIFPCQLVNLEGGKITWIISDDVNFSG